MRRIRLSLIGLAVVVSYACGASHVPPNLSPESLAKWQATRAVKALDVVRDVAIAGNAIQPPIISTDDTRIVVEFHQSAVTVIAQTPQGWRPAVKASLSEALKHVSPDTAATLKPYVGLVSVIIDEVNR